MLLALRNLFTDVKTVLESAMHKTWPITLHALPQNRESGSNTRHVMGYMEGDQLVHGKVHLSGSGGTENRAVRISQGQPKHANSTPAFCVLSNRRSYLMGSWVKNSGPWEDRGTLASQGKQEVWMDGKGGQKHWIP